MNAWIGLIGTLLGAIIGGSLVLYRESSQRKYARASERRELLIHKYEVLHELLTSVRKNIGLLSIDLIGHIGLQDKINFENYLNKIPTDAVLMNTQFYVPSLNTKVDKLYSMVNEYFRAFSIVTVQKCRAPENERLVLAEQCMNISNKIDGYIKEINIELSQIAKELIHET